mmetsp:Transcript_11842/g.15545  ORF Transcript_11842/g.15545 Transcript_11842/m.15545 type:complete len:234 (+) Transcript_11842:178-879(+)
MNFILFLTLWFQVCCGFHLIHDSTYPTKLTIQKTSLAPLRMSSQAQDDESSTKQDHDSDDLHSEKTRSNLFKSLMKLIQDEQGRQRPPLQVEDQDVMIFDVFLLINLTLSISMWVVHRTQIEYIGAAFNEGCLLAFCWLIAGLWNGAFLNSAVDGHYGSSDERAGPKAAAFLALNTYVGVINLRLLFALIVAVVEHRQVGGIGGEEFMPLELGFGLILMSSWRFFHSSVIPRM